MSEVKIQIRSEGYGLQIPRTCVYVDNKFAYQSGNNPKIELDNLMSLITQMQIDNFIVEISNKKA